MPERIGPRGGCASWSWPGSGGKCASRSPRSPSNWATVDSEPTDLAITRSTLLRLAAGRGSPPPADTTIASHAHQQISAVFAITGHSGLPAEEFGHALGIGRRQDTEELPAKLKRLVARGVLTEPEPGLFTLAQPATSSPKPNVRAITDTPSRNALSFG